jgi:hypothetical protein
MRYCHMQGILATIHITKKNRELIFAKKNTTAVSMYYKSFFFYLCFCLIIIGFGYTSLKNLSRKLYVNYANTSYIRLKI